MTSTSPTSSSGLVTVSTDPDIRIFYTITPPLPINTSRPILVFSSSLAANTTLWDETAAYFAKTHTIIRYDARFHGRSPLSRTPGFSYAAGHSMEDLARDVVAILDALSVPPDADVSFIGLSIGAGIGVTLAGNVAPGRFRKLVIVGTKAQASKSDGPVYDSRIKLAREEAGMRRQAQESVIRWFGQEWAAAHPDKAAVVEDMVAGQSVDGFEASIFALRHLDLWPHVDTIKQRGDGHKLLFVVGEQEPPAMLEDNEKLAERCGSKLVVVSGAGHIVNMQQPDEFHRIVREWLEKSW